MSTTLAERFWSRVQKTDGCWLWTGAVHRTRNGYGYLGKRIAHRLSWELHFGPIPPGMIVCHSCDNPPCVRPDHLFLGTHKTNSDDKIAKGRSRAGEWQRARTHCPQGHPYDEANTYVYADGRRECRECRRLKNERRRDRLNPDRQRRNRRRTS